MTVLIPELAQQVATALTVGVAAGWLVFHFARRGPLGDGAPGCARCPANVDAGPQKAATSRREVADARPRRLPVIQ